MFVFLYFCIFALCGFVCSIAPCIPNKTEHRLVTKLCWRGKLRQRRLRTLYDLYMHIAGSFLTWIQGTGGLQGIIPLTHFSSGVAGGGNCPLIKTANIILFCFYTAAIYVRTCGEHATLLMCDAVETSKTDPVKQYPDIDPCGWNIKPILIRIVIIAPTCLALYHIYPSSRLLFQVSCFKV